MTDNSSTGSFDNEIQYPLRKLTYDGNIFHLLDLNKTQSYITGNKAWKLKYNVEAWKVSGDKHLLTFGGAYSNHIYQTAKLGHHLGIPTIGMIRGEIDDVDNQTLRDAEAWDMQLIPVDRSTYRRRNDPEFLAELESSYDCFIVPEGGTNSYAIKGTKDLGNLINTICEGNGIYNIAVPVGTGGTIAGIIEGTTHKTILGYGALKGNFFKKDISKWLSIESSNWTVEDDQLIGGYGKWNQDLIEFIKSFYDQTGVILDPIYTGKMMYAAFKADRLNQDWLYIHTGGLQGNRGFNQRFGLDLPTS